MLPRRSSQARQTKLAFSVVDNRSNDEGLNDDHYCADRRFCERENGNCRKRN